MAVIREHVPWVKDAFALDGFAQDPVLLFGYHDIYIEPAYFKTWRSAAADGEAFKLARLRARDFARAVTGRAPLDSTIPDEFAATTVAALLRQRGLRDIHCVDLFDARADLRYDMNQPVPESEHAKYGTVIDIGSIEHVFDTRQCLENCVRMVRPGGHYLLNTTVKGYHLHGLHTFNPEGFLLALTENGFELRYHAYCTVDGKPIDNPSDGEDVLIWLVGRKIADVGVWVSPQQGKWHGAYPVAGQPERVTVNAVPSKRRLPARLRPLRIVTRAVRRTRASALLSRGPLPRLRTRLLRLPAVPPDAATRDVPPPGYDIDVDGVTLRLPDASVGSYYHGYERLTTTWLIERLHPGMVAVDVGAHLGYFALVMAKQVGPGGRVFAVEPAADNLVYLRHNVARHGATNVDVVDAAAGAVRQRRAFHLTGSSDSHGFFDHPLTATIETVQVQEVPLDELVYRADVVKIDVEGAELGVLSGMARLLEQDPAPRLVVEWTPACQVRAGHHPRAVIDALEVLGYEIRVAHDQAGTWVTVGEVLELVEKGELAAEWYANLLCEPKAT